MKFYSLLFMIALCAPNINSRYVEITEEKTDLVTKDKKKKKLNWLQKLFLACMRPEKKQKNTDNHIDTHENISPEDRLD